MPVLALLSVSTCNVVIIAQFRVLSAIHLRNGKVGICCVEQLGQLVPYRLELCAVTTPYEIKKCAIYQLQSNKNHR